MENRILELVKEINTREGKDVLDCYPLGNIWFVKEYSDTREPNLSTFNTIEECYKYLSGLNRLKSSAFTFESVQVVEEEEEKLYDVWYLGKFLGLYRADSFENACRIALKKMGMFSNDIEIEVTINKHRLTCFGS